MINDIVQLYRAVHAEVPGATVDEISAAMRAYPGADANTVALAIWEARPDEDEDEDDDDEAESRAARLAFRDRNVK
jgi:hypothetical protein